QRAEPAVKCTALLGLAHVFMAQEEPKKALRHLKAAEAADADEFAADGWVLKGQIHEALGQRGEALTAYQKALEHESDAPDILASLVRLATATGKRDEALDYLRQL